MTPLYFTQDTSVLALCASIIPVLFPLSMRDILKMFYYNLVVVFKLSLSFGITVSPDLFAILGWFIGDELPQTPPASKAAKY